MSSDLLQRLAGHGRLTKAALRCDSPLRPGDVVGFSSSEWTGWIINGGTWGLPLWGLSHVALVAAHPDDGRPVLFESTSLYNEPCLLQGEIVEGVQCHEIWPRVEAYRGKVWHYPRRRSISAEQSVDLTEFCMSNLGTSYDRIGAFRSRGAGFGWFEKFFLGQDLTSLFCSEFAAVALDHIEAFYTANASKWNPNALCRALLRRGISQKPVRLK